MHSIEGQYCLPPYTHYAFLWSSNVHSSSWRVVCTEVFMDILAWWFYNWRVCVCVVCVCVCVCVCCVCGCGCGCVCTCGHACVCMRARVCVCGGGGGVHFATRHRNCPSSTLPLKWREMSTTSTTWRVEIDRDGARWLFFFFFTQVQTPVTLFSGELRSILVVRLAHSAYLNQDFCHTCVISSVFFITFFCLSCQNVEAPQEPLHRWNDPHTYTRTHAGCLQFKMLASVRGSSSF